MTVYVIHSNDDKGFNIVKDMFYNNFTPDDWDYIIVGGICDYDDVKRIAKALFVFDYQIKIFDNHLMAVTYHS